MFSGIKTYLYMGMAVFVLLSITTAYLKGRRDASQAAVVSELNSQVEALKRGLEISEMAATRSQIAQAEAQSNELQANAKVEDYEKELASRPSAPQCELTDDDVKRLRALSGQAE
jgi:outer membrane murein-binding lipoprotein Lpp